MADKILHVHDRLLGHVPRPGAHGAVPDGGAVTIGADGLRCSGDIVASAHGPILAVGDSFTWGEEVSDADTWPAHLQRLLGRRVLNGGVTGFGFDQIVLQTERLVAIHRPSIVIVSFIADDVRRTEMRRMWWHDKPWFAIEDGKLVLRGVPVPRPRPLSAKLRRRFDRHVSRLPPVLQGMLGYHARIHRAGTGRVLALRLTRRLARLQAEYPVRIVVMAQYDPRAWSDRALAVEQRGLTRPVLACAERHGMATLDTFGRLAAEPKPLALYRDMHLNARGNLTIARLLAAALPVLLGPAAARGE